MTIMEALKQSIGEIGEIRLPVRESGAAMALARVGELLTSCVNALERQAAEAAKAAEAAEAAKAAGKAEEGAAMEDEAPGGAVAEDEALAMEDEALEETVRAL